MKPTVHLRPQDRRRCAAMDCAELVPPQLLMCAVHWRLVPRDLRERIKRHYRIGQERRHDATPEYMGAAALAVRAVAELQGRPVPPMPGQPDANGGTGC